MEMMNESQTKVKSLPMVKVNVARFDHTHHVALKRL